MKTLFIEAKYQGKIKINKKDIAKLPNKIGLAATVQFIGKINELKKLLKTKKIFSAGQILGCNISKANKIKNKVDAFLYLGTGHFHAIALGLLGKDVYILNPFDGIITKLDKKEIINYKKRKKTAMLKFLNADNVGVLISTKPGQSYDIKKLYSLERKYPKKKFYFFVADTIDINQFENFNFIQAWINTACPRLEEDYILLNISDLK